MFLKASKVVIINQLHEPSRVAKLESLDERGIAANEIDEKWIKHTEYLPCLLHCYVTVS